MAYELERLLSDSEEIQAIILASIEAKASSKGREVRFEDVEAPINALLTAAYELSTQSTSADPAAGKRAFAELLRNQADTIMKSLD